MRKDLFSYRLTSAKMFAKIGHKYFILKEAFQSEWLLDPVFLLDVLLGRFIQIHRLRFFLFFKHQLKCRYCTVMGNVKKEKRLHEPSSENEPDFMATAAFSSTKRSFPPAASHQSF